MKKKGLFVVGTDTDAGKTFITALLGGLFKKAGYLTGVVKPIASGAIRKDDGQIYSGDADELMRLSKLDERYRSEVNPFCIEGDFSPKTAAQLLGVDIPVENILCDVKKTINKYDYTFVEGAGGVTTPIRSDFNFADFGKSLNIPALLVADGRLGSINRTVLSVAYLRSHGVSVAGIIINDEAGTDSFLLDSNKAEMELYTNLPVLAVVPKYEGPKNVDAELDWGERYINVKAILQAWENVLT